MMRSVVFIFCLFIASNNFAQSQDSLIFDLVNVKGRVTDSRTGKGLKAIIIIQSEGDTQSVLCDDSGYYRCFMQEKKSYTFTLELKDYLFASYTISSLKGQNDFQLQRMTGCHYYRIPSILFEVGTARFLDSIQEQTLDKLALILQENPSLRIHIVGHTDSKGSSKKKHRLSEERVNEVIIYLFGEGIELKRLGGEGLGDSQPLVSNDTEENRQINNRVEFLIEEE